MQVHLSNISNAEFLCTSNLSQIIAMASFKYQFDSELESDESSANF